MPSCPGCGVKWGQPCECPEPCEECEVKDGDIKKLREALIELGDKVETGDPIHEALQNAFTVLKETAK